MLVVFSALEKTENLLTLPGIEPKFVIGQTRSLVTILVKIFDSYNRLTSHLKVYMFANHLEHKFMIRLGGDEFKKPFGPCAIIFVFFTKSLMIIYLKQ